MIAEAAESTDPRVLRTRVMLFQALQALLNEKDFEKISVGEIAERATLNRATFYDHYPDKFTLLQCMIADRFEELIAARGLRFDGCDEALASMALTVCDFLSSVRCTATTQRQLEMHSQMAMVATVKTMIVRGLDATGSGDAHARTIVATGAAWAICGMGNQWIQNPNRSSSEEMAQTIAHLVQPMFAEMHAPA